MGSLFQYLLPAATGASQGLLNLSLANQKAKEQAIQNKFEMEKANLPYHYLKNAPEHWNQAITIPQKYRKADGSKISLEEARKALEANKMPADWTPYDPTAEFRRMASDKDPQYLGLAIQAVNTMVNNARKQLESNAMVGLTGYTLPAEATDPEAFNAAVERQYFMLKHTKKTGGTPPTPAVPKPKGTITW